MQENSFKSIVNFVTVLMVMLSINVGNSQCDVDVEVPDDITLCNAQDFTLEGIINGSEECHLWVDNFGILYDDSDTEPEVFVSTTTTYTFSAFGSIPGPNLISNGDFESGDSGFSTDYDSSCPPNPFGILGCEGAYAIDSDPLNTHTNFSSCSDHTGGGLMMVVNGSSSPVNVWCQDVAVEAGKKYFFSAWGQSVNPDSPALLQFSIDGLNIGNTLSLSSSTCDWEEATATYIATATTSAEVCVTNQNTATSGNDFAIDDIFLGELCSDVKEFTVTIEELLINPTAAPTFDCETLDALIELNPSGTGAPYTYLWDNLDGNPIDNNFDGTAFIYAPGDYLVTVTDDFGCTAEHIFEVELLAIPPTLDLQPDTPLLSCGQAFIELYNDQDQAGYAYEWELGGIFVSDEDEIQADQAGIYSVTVTDSNNGCSSTAEIEVLQSGDVPNITLQFTNTIDCNNPWSTLLVDSPENISFVNWEDEDNNTIATGIANEGGIYFVTVTTDSGCTATGNITVPEIPFNPLYTLLTPDPIDCNNPLSILEVESTESYDFSWSGPNMFSGSGNSLQISSSGTYVLFVTDTNGCSQSSQIEVIGDTTPPLASINLTSNLSCDVELVNLSIDNPDPNNNYAWTLPNSSIVNGSSFDTGTPGDYSVLVTAPNGCTTTNIITINQEGNLPTLSISATDISCGFPSSFLVDFGNYNTLNWSDADGQTLTDLEITEGGWYYAYADNGLGCDLLDSVFVAVDTLTPSAQFNIQDLSCDLPSYTLTNDLDGDYMYLWINPEGIVGVMDSFIIDIPGDYSVLIGAENGCGIMEEFTVLGDFDLPTFEVEGIEKLDCLTSSFDIHIDNLDPGSTVQIDGPNTQNIGNEFPFTIDHGGLFSITVSNIEGCSFTKTFEIEVDSSMTQTNFDIFDIDCFNPIGGAEILNPISNAEYTWNSALNSITDTALETIIAGTYELQVLNTDNGCIETKFFDIEIDTISPIISAMVDSLDCLNQSTTIEIEGQLDYNYSWTFPDQTMSQEQDPLVSEVGLYFLEVTGSNGCNSIFEIEVPGNISLPVVSIEPIQAIDCINTSSTLIINTNEASTLLQANFEGNDYEFTNNELIINEPGAWLIYITGASGCTGEIEINIPVDTFVENPILELNNINCQDLVGSANLLQSGVGYQYEWFDNNGVSTTGNNFITDEAGDFALVTTANNGCTADQLFEILIDQEAPDLEITANVITCTEPATVAVVNPEADLNYSWNFGMDTPSQESSFVTSEAGTYLATAINPINHCETTQEIEVMQDENFPTDFSFLLQEPPCGESDFVFSDLEVVGGTGPYSYSINGNVITTDLSTADLLQPGDQNLQVFDDNGCTIDSVFVLEIPEDLLVEGPELTLISFGETGKLEITVNKDTEEIESILWEPSTGLSCTDCLDPTVNILESQDYTVTIVDINGCQDQIMIRVETELNVSVYLPNVFTPDAINNTRFLPYANPELVNTIRSFYIFDRWGNRVFSNLDFPPNSEINGWDGKILEGDATNGVYAYIIEVEYVDGKLELIAGDLTLIR